LYVGNITRLTFLISKLTVPASPGVATAGISGGTSSFGALITATGGAGGTATFGAAGAFTSIPQGFGFQGSPGGQGGNPFATTTSVGNGGNSFQLWGFGAPLPATPAPGTTGIGYGSGGSGGIGGPLSPVAGGAGAIGYVIVEEFY